MKKNISRTEEFEYDRFGMFLHWGLYAIPGRGEWARSHEEMAEEHYIPFFEEFSAKDFDAHKWAHTAKKAGMKYAVLTAKHHDGFCLFDSKYTEFKSTNTPCKKDIVREFLEAFREQGIKVGLYYSLLDWHHKDYPHYGDKFHPMRNNREYPNENRNFENYRAYMFHQIEELLSSYGKIDIMWFDFSYDVMRGEKWHGAELVNMVRALQPEIILDNRLEGDGAGLGSILSKSPGPYAGDFASPEQIIPPEGIQNVCGESIPWEVCMTLNNNWGYVAEDTHYKTAKMVIQSLVECTSKGGNLLVNIGPDANGNIPAEAEKVLEDVGRWMDRNGESIYGCGNAHLPKPDWGWFTRKSEKVLYAHVFEPQVGAVCLKNMAENIDKLRLVMSGTELKISKYWNLEGYKNHAFFFFNEKTADSYPLPDERDTVVKIYLK